jgi:transposase
MELIQKLLIVEGIDDKYVINRLLQRRKITYQHFEIRDANGIKQSLNTFSIAIKSGNYEVIGIVVDADTDLSERWQDLRNRLIKEGYQHLPQNPNAKGTIIIDPEEELPTVGIWLMPNNTGMLEDFIRFLVPEGDELLPIAQS